MAEVAETSESTSQSTFWLPLIDFSVSDLQPIKFFLDLVGCDCSRRVWQGHVLSKATLRRHNRELTLEQSHAARTCRPRQMQRPRTVWPPSCPRYLCGASAKKNLELLKPWHSQISQGSIYPWLGIEVDCTAIVLAFSFKMCRHGALSRCDTMMHGLHTDNVHSYAIEPSIYGGKSYYTWKICAHRNMQRLPNRTIFTIRTCWLFRAWNQEYAYISLKF